MSATLWHRKIVQPIIGFLRQGLTPEKLAFTLALGITLGVVPVLGSTMLLCTLAAIIFRLNLAAIQLVNWLVYPLQLALLIPFYRVGAWIFRTRPTELSVLHIVTLIRGNLVQAITTLWTVTVHAIVAWVLLGSILTGLLYLIFVPILRGLRNQPRPTAGEEPC